MKCPKCREGEIVGTVIKVWTLPLAKGGGLKVTGDDAMTVAALRARWDASVIDEEGGEGGYHLVECGACGARFEYVLGEGLRPRREPGAEAPVEAAVVAAEEPEETVDLGVTPEEDDAGVAEALEVLDQKLTAAAPRPARLDPKDFPNLSAQLQAADRGKIPPEAAPALVASMVAKDKADGGSAVRRRFRLPGRG